MTDDNRRDPIRLLYALLELFDQLDDAETNLDMGRGPSDGASIDYSLTVGHLDDTFGGLDSSHELSPAVTTRQFEDELLVVADLPNAPAADVEVMLDPVDRALVILVAGEERSRVPLADFGSFAEWSIADVSLNNAVLEVHLTDE